MKQSKFALPPKPFKERAANFAQSMLFWKGRKKGMIHTRSIKWDDIRFIFCPKNENEKYEYLGYIYVTRYPGNANGEESIYYKPIMDIVRAMDRKARPWWCPRFFLRFLEVFGNDRSIVRVRNFALHNLHKKLLKGYRFVDWKTKWSWYDLRISVHACNEIWELVEWTEEVFYQQGLEQEKKDYPEIFED
jgi:hypothetical protein